MATPGWQTDDLVDEWVSESSSPSPSINRSLAKSTSSTADLISPDSDQTSSTDSILSISSLGSKGRASPTAGTFLIREDQPLPDTPLGLKPGQRPKRGAIKDFFSPLALERMFEPPSPPRATSTPNDSPSSTTPPSPFPFSTQTSRPQSRASLPAPTSVQQRTHTRSKLSQSYIPPPLSASTSSEDVTRNSVAPVVTSKEPETDEIISSDIPGLTTFDGRKPSAAFEFTFQPPKAPGLNVSQRRSPPHPAPNPRALQTPETSWVHAEQTPGLKLFQFKYDSFTRDHLGALADSIAVRSPSSEEEVDGDGDDRESDTVWRSTKRIRLSPPEGRVIRKSSSRDFRNSPWGRTRAPTRLTSNGTASTGTLKSNDEEQLRHRQISSSSAASTVALLTPMDAAFPLPIPAPPARNYRLQGANILKMIKQDVLKTSPNVSIDERDGLSTIADTSREESLKRMPGRMNWKVGEDEEEEEEEEDEDKGPQSPTKSARKSLVAGDRSLVEEKSLQDLRAKHLPHLTNSQRVVPPPPTIIFNARVPTQAPPPLPTNRRVPSSLHPSRVPQEDMNRFVSSSTMTSALSGTTAGSFVKHAGPQAPQAQGQMRTIKPEEVQGVLPSQFGGMVYEPQTHKWIRQRGTDESDDPFGDIESLADTTRGSQGPPQPLAKREVQEVDGDQIEEEQDGDASREENQPSEELFAEDSEPEQDQSSGQVPPPITTEPVQYDSDSTATTTSPLTVPTPPTEDPPEADKPTPKSRARTLEELSESLANMSMQMDLSPPRPIRPFTVPSQTPKPSIVPAPRSVLKSVPFFVNGPVKKQQQTPRNLDSADRRRSVSFSDGRKSGKIRELAGSQPEETTEEMSTLGTMTGQGSANIKAAEEAANMAIGQEITGDASLEEPSANPTSSFVPSVRTQRIHALFNNLDESGGNNTFVSQQKSGRRQSRSRSAGDDGKFTPSNRVFSRTKARIPGETTFMTEASFRVTQEQLVRVLSSIQPYEPYWEQLSEIDISRKGVESLGRLDELLPNLIYLIANENGLTWLTGIPGGLRNLSAAHNQLTSLTSYGHLVQLEQLDISNNQVDSLDQLACLRHLRTLKADGNKLTSLDGVGRSASLVELSAKGNCLTEIDFNDSTWKRLEILDLSGNSLRLVSGFGALPALVSLNLERNELEAFACDTSMEKLRILRLSDNLISRIDLSSFAGLKTLYMDHNRLGTVVGAERLKRLENLSLRSQAGALSLSLGAVRDVKRLYLSGNALDKRNLFTEPLYNLVYLEMASCRLSTLPPTFSQMVPNLRALNLNYNFLTDVAKPLVGLTRLRKLTIVGSRVKASKAIVRMLQRMPELEQFDARMNPFSLGWYLPLLVTDLAGALHPSDRALSSRRGESESWSQMDDRFRRDLPDDVYVARMGFRGLVMRSCAKILTLDGVTITVGERDKAQRLLEGLERSIKARPLPPVAKAPKR